MAFTMRPRRSLTARTAYGATALALVTLGLSGCSDDEAPPPAVASPQAPEVASMRVMGQPEGELNIVAWAGYAEDGTNDPTVDWVTPFAETTRCTVNVKVASTSDEMVTLMKTGQYDGVSAPGDATLRLVYGGDVAPVNTDLVPNYETISPFLKDRPWNSVDGQMYGVPHGWGANLLMSRSDVVTPAPDSWGAVFDPKSPYKGKVTAYDSPIYIADAALYLKAARPELGITSPYALDDKQFAAAVDLLERQRALVGEYWSDYTKEVQAFEGGDAVIGTSWQVIATLINGGGKAKVDAVVPKEGSTGWSDTWMVSSKAKHPVCMYKWMNWITSPTVNAQAAEWFGQAPSQTLACQETEDEAHCDTYHATDAAYAEKIAYWTTPTTSCGDARGNVCKDYAAWTQAWSEITG